MANTKNVKDVMVSFWSRICGPVVTALHKEDLAVCVIIVLCVLILFVVVPMMQTVADKHTAMIAVASVFVTVKIVIATARKVKVSKMMALKGKTMAMTTKVGKETLARRSE